MAKHKSRLRSVLERHQRSVQMRSVVQNKLARPQAPIVASKQTRKVHDHAGRQFPYRPSDRLLLVGEANFSFAVSIATLLWPARCQQTSTSNVDASKSDPVVDKEEWSDVEDVSEEMLGWLIATTLDSREITFEKYPDAESNTNLLQSWGFLVLFDFDATNNSCYLSLRKQEKRCADVNRIVFNFPHVGLGITDQERNILANQRLLLSFFRTASSFLLADTERPMKPKKKKKRNLSCMERAEQAYPTLHLKPVRDVQLVVTMKSGQPYDQWQIKRLAKSTGVLFCQKSFFFLPEMFPGYAHRRSLGFQPGLSAAENEEIKGKDCRTYIFTCGLDNFVQPTKKQRAAVSSDDE